MVLSKIGFDKHEIVGKFKQGPEFKACNQYFWMFYTEGGGFEKPFAAIKSLFLADSVQGRDYKDFEGTLNCDRLDCKELFSSSNCRINTELTAENIVRVTTKMWKCLAQELLNVFFVLAFGATDYKTQVLSYLDEESFTKKESTFVFVV